MKTMKVSDMHCEKCVERISKALAKEEIEYKVNLAGKTVEVEESKASAAVRLLDDLGFSVEE